MEAESSVRAVIAKVKEGMSEFEDATSRLIQKIKDEVKSISYDVFAGFDDIFNDIDSLPSYLEDFGKAIENMFQVTTQRAYHTAIEFDDAIEHKVMAATHNISAIGSRTYQPLDKFKQTVESRIKSESDTVDLLVLVFCRADHRSDHRDLYAYEVDHNRSLHRSLSGDHSNRRVDLGVGWQAPVVKCIGSILSDVVDVSFDSRLSELTQVIEERSYVDDVPLLGKVLRDHLIDHCHDGLGVVDVVVSYIAESDDLDTHVQPS